MTLKNLLLTVLLLCLFSVAASKLQYALSIPAKLNSGELGKACVNLQGYEQTLSLSVVLQHKGVNTTIFTENVCPPSYFQCNNFEVPKVSNSVPALVLLSVSGEGTTVLKRQTVVISVVRNIFLVQMDKPIYKPGQRVLFNVISLDQKLLPVNQMYSTIYLTDPSGSRIAQWLNQKSNGGMVPLEFSLVDDAVVGSYYITGQSESSNAFTRYFRVKDVVLPRFDATLNAPSTASVLDESLPYNVSTKYTYGEPVPGTISIIWCRQRTYGRVNNCYRDKFGVCFYKTADLASDGTYQGVMDLTSIQMDLSGAQTSLNLSITVTESGTGIQVTKTQYIWVTSQLASISFDYDTMTQYYKRGLNYSATLFLRDENGLPKAGREVELNIGGVPEIKKIITDVDGRAKYEIDTSNFLNQNFTIRASYPNTDQCYYGRWRGPDYPTTEYTVYRFYSATGSFLQINSPQGTLKCGQKQKIDVQFTLSTEGVGVGATKARFYYLTMSRARIIHSGQQEVDLTCGRNGVFSIHLPITSEIAFRTNLIVYSLLRNELIADTKSLTIENCFKNEVSLRFSEKVGTPGSDVGLQISASPGSLCAIKVIDSSLLLLNSDMGVTPEAVFNSLQNWLYGYYVESFNLEEPEPPCDDPNKEIFYNGNYYLPVSSDSEGDTYNNLKNIGLIVGTDATTRKPKVCKPRKFEEMYYTTRKSYGTIAMKGAVLESAAAPMARGPEAIETVRNNFSDTWVWSMVSTNSQGNGSISQKAPDTITEWKGSMICTSEKDGFGMTKKPAQFTTFLQFFVEMSLTYSFVRGEILVLNAFVSNYLQQCVKVQVNFMKSDSYVAVPKEGKQNACICTGKRASYTWNINALSLGVISFTVSAQTTFIGQTCDGANDPSQPPRKDTVIQSIIVEAEGIKKEVTSSNLICMSGNTPSSLSLPIKLIPPQNVVLGSASGFITVLGDIVGLPLQNLQNLLLMPYGCGEQNLVRMAPIPHLLDYLNSTGQLTDEILKKAIDLMNSGYYRELGYRMWSGAYSLFGGAYMEANSWLTCYVFNTFHNCKKYIYIDDHIQEQALISLGKSQNLETGCFKPIGRPFITRRGGADDDISYTAFIAISLLESDYSLGMTLLDSTLTCLQNALKNNQNIYNQALMAYAFTLAQDWDRRCTLLKSLRSKAISEGGMIHWEEEDKPATRPFEFYVPIYSSADVAITSYILLCIAKGPNVTQEEMTFMAQIAVWLTRQQNSYGGFRSTKDTAVALQAFAVYGKLIFNPNAQHSIQVNGGNMPTSKLMYNKDNRLLVQRQSLSVPGDYNVGISGIGCCLVQTTVKYSVPVPQENSAFLLLANTSSKSCVNGVAYTFSIDISLSYRGKRNQTNIVIVDITMLSGYHEDYWSLRKMKDANVISNSVTKNNHLYLYLKSVSQKTTYLSVNFMMGSRVLNVKTGIIYVYDYSETAENGYASYRHPCAQQ